MLKDIFLMNHPAGQRHITDPEVGDMIFFQISDHPALSFVFILSFLALI